MRKFVNISLISIGFGLFVVLWHVIIWQFVASGLYIITEVLVFIVSYIMFALLLIRSITLVKSSQTKFRFMGLLPLVATIISIILSLILPGVAINYYEKYLFSKRYDQYSRVVLSINKDSYPENNKKYKLPKEFKHLTQNGDFRVEWRNDQVNIWFPVRSTIGSGEFFVYSSTGKLFNKSKYLTWKVIRDKWLHVAEYD